MHYSILAEYIASWENVGYILVFLGMMIEGDALLFSTAFLVSRGLFAFSPALAAVVGGVLIGDFLWYMAGRWVGERYPFVNKWLGRVTKRFDEHLLARPSRTFFVTKFAYGLHHPILMRAGILGMPFKKFFESDLRSSFGWILAVGALGYFSGTLWEFFEKSIRYVEVLLLLGLFLFLLSEHFFTIYSKRSANGNGCSNGENLASREKEEV